MSTIVTICGSMRFLALHAPETKRVQAGTVTICAHCGSQLWPCFTAQALGVTS